MRIRRLSTFAVLVGLLMGCEPDMGGAPTVTLHLGGKFCEAYPDAITSALMKVEGVRTVDLTSKKGHVVVTGDPGKMMARTLRNAVNGVKGEGWHCEVDVVD